MKIYRTTGWVGLVISNKIVDLITKIDSSRHRCGAPRLATARRRDAGAQKENLCGRNRDLTRERRSREKVWKKSPRATNYNNLTITITNDTARAAVLVSDFRRRRPPLWFSSYDPMEITGVCLWWWNYEYCSRTNSHSINTRRTACVKISWADWAADPQNIYFKQTSGSYATRVNSGVCFVFLFMVNLYFEQRLPLPGYIVWEIAATA